MVEIPGGTPMIVQSMVIYYGNCPSFWYQPNRTLSCYLHQTSLTVNTGAYMTEIVRGGILAVDKWTVLAAIARYDPQSNHKIVLP